MNILTYIPIPMPIVVHGGSGSVTVPHYTGICFVGAVGILALGLLGLCCAMLCSAFDRDDDIPLKAAGVLISISMLLFVISILCLILGV